MCAKLVCYTHDDLRYFTIHQYQAENAFRFELRAGRPNPALVHVAQGSARFEMADACVNASAGDWVYIPQGICYRTLWTGQTITYDTLDFKMERRLIMQHVPHVSVVELNFEQPTDRICVFARRHAGLERKLAMMYPYFEVREPLQNILAAAVFYEMWHDVLSCFANRIADAEIAPAVTYIEDHLPEPLQTETLYRLCCMSKSSFFKRFRMATGTSPVQYRNRLLVRMGKKLLAEGRYTIEQVSDMLGLCSPDYFTVLCKKEARKERG